MDTQEPAAEGLSGGGILRFASRAVAEHDRRMSTSTRPGTAVSEFQTSDTQVASFLIVLGHRLLAIGGPRTQRVFAFPAEAEADHALYYTDSAPLVSARRLFSAYRDLMSAMHRVP